MIINLLTLCIQFCLFFWSLLFHKKNLYKNFMGMDTFRYCALIKCTAIGWISDHPITMNNWHDFNICHVSEILHWKNFQFWRFLMIPGRNEKYLSINSQYKWDCDPNSIYKKTTNSKFSVKRSSNSFREPFFYAGMS